MSSQGSERSAPLGGREYPAHELRQSAHFVAGGILLALYAVPITASFFWDTDRVSVQARPGSVVFYVLLAAWTGGWLMNAIKYRKLVRSAYARDQLVSCGRGMLVWGNRVRWVLIWISALTWAAMMIVVHEEKSYPPAIPVSGWLALAFLFSGLPALVLTTLISASHLESEAYRRETAHGLEKEILVRGAAMAEKADLAVHALAERISRRIAELDLLSAQVNDLERERQVAELALKPEILKLYNEAYGLSDRKSTRLQWLFLGLSFVLGFVVNWLSSPALTLFRHIHF